METRIAHIATAVRRTCPLHWRTICRSPPRTWPSRTRTLQLDAFLAARVHRHTVGAANPSLFAQLNTWVTSIKPANGRPTCAVRSAPRGPVPGQVLSDAAFESVAASCAANRPRAPLATGAGPRINTAGPYAGPRIRASLPSAQKQAESVAQDVRDALARGIENNTWMSAPATSRGRVQIAN